VSGGATSMRDAELWSADPEKVADAGASWGAGATH